MRPTVHALLLLGSIVPAQGTDDAPDGPPLNDTGGVLLPEQAAYDVTQYSLDVELFPDERRIEGICVVSATALAPLSVLVLDLDTALEVRGARADGMPPLEVERDGGRVRVVLGREVPPGEDFEVAVLYGGAPRVAPRPPWEGGFTWARTEAGEHWIATSCQMEGADLWWPCKDHPSDKADRVNLHVTVPDPLVVAANGRFIAKVDRGDGKTTYNWSVTTPIANYAVALNVAPYVELVETYRSPTGERWPFRFWVLPEHEEEGRAILPEFMEHMRFFEELLGPYPFRADKYGVAETPHLGMEHQTVIAYGNEFREFEWGFDWLHHHELAHEWFANLVTAPDWSDFWVHEGFAQYLQKLWVERTHGEEGYRKYLAQVRGRILNAKPVAPRGARSSAQMYFRDLSGPAGSRPSDGDIYFKGEWILHTLRWLIGDEAFFDGMRRICYPTPEHEQVTDGSHVHFTTTDDVQRVFEASAKTDLGWFFELYLRQPELPELVVEVVDGELHLRWKTPGGMPFPMPVEVRVGEEYRRVEMVGGKAAVELPDGAVDWAVDPRDRVLRPGNRLP